MTYRISSFAAVAALLFAGAVSAQALSKDDADFLKKAAEVGLTEIEGSKLAASKTTDPQVKSFADKMVTDHTKMGEQVEALAAAKQVQLPSEPTLVQRGKLKLLGAMKGHTFDERYASQIGVGAHEDTVKLFRKASTDAKDPEVKSLATQALPQLEAHLKMANELKMDVDKHK